MNITLNIGLNVSKHYLPEGVEEMKLQYKYVKEYLEEHFGKPIYIELAQSATEETVLVHYTNVEFMLQMLFWLASEFKQDCIAYQVQDDAGNVLGGALVGKYAHEWNNGIFDKAYFIKPRFI